jgi:hypothetical protein
MAYTKITMSGNKCRRTPFNKMIFNGTTLNRKER